MELSGYGCEIIGTGAAFGAQVVHAREIEARLKMRPGWVVERTGVAERRVAVPGERPTDLGARAAEQALEAAGVAPTDIDLLICATMTAEMPCPATAQQIAARIGAVPCGAFDLTSACTGYLTAMHLAANNIRAGVNRNILVVGTDLLSPTIDANDYKMAAIFGDAASAAVVSRSDNPAKGCFGQMMCADGREWAAVYQPRCPEDMPPGVDEPERYGILIMNGLAVYRFAVETMVQIIPEVLAGQGLTLADADLVLVHQSNLRIIERVRDALDLDANKCPSVIEWTGNTSGGSVGVVLDTVRRDGRLKPGMTVVLAAVGGGLSWGASVWKV